MSVTVQVSGGEQTSRVRPTVLIAHAVAVLVYTPGAWWSVVHV